MSDMYRELTLVSLKAHFVALRHLFYIYLEQSSNPNRGQRAVGMKLWFERERFLAFGRSPGLNSDQLQPMPFDELSTLYDKAQETMVSLYQKLECELHQTGCGEHKDSGNIGEESVLDGRILENDVYELVGSLWDLLSLIEKRKAEDEWVRAMLNTEDIENLDNIGRTFGLEDDSVYEKGAAMAMMEKLRLAISSEPWFNSYNLDLWFL